MFNKISFLEHIHFIDWFGPMGFIDVESGLFSVFVFAHAPMQSALCVFVWYACQHHS